MGSGGGYGEWGRRGINKKKKKQFRCEVIIRLKLV